jgi:hypothetical protein
VNNDTLAAYEQSNTASGDNCSILDNSPYQCSNTYSNYVDGTSWVNPGSLPTRFPGTAPLSDTTGQLTSLDFYVYTLSLFPAYSTVITPAPFNATNAAATGCGQGVLTGSIKTSGRSATGTVQITALVPTTTATGKIGGSGAGTTTGSSGSAFPTPSKAGTASMKEGLSLDSFVSMIGLLAL